MLEFAASFASAASLEFNTRYKAVGLRGVLYDVIASCGTKSKKGEGRRKNTKRGARYAP